MAQHTYSRSRTDWDRVRKKALWTAVVILLAVGGFLIFAFRINQFSVSLRLLGEETILLEFGESYIEPGVQLLLQGTHLFPEGIVIENANISCSGEFDEETVGKYQLQYTGYFFGMRGDVQRTVSVIDSESPVITLSNDVTKRWHIGYTAMDNYDGDITDRVKCVENLGRMSFAVMDSSGNPAYIEKSVPFYDVDPPKIELVGGTTDTVPVSYPYEEPGFSAIDNADGLMTDRVLSEGEVNCFIPGNYPITYTVIDSAGNEGKVVRNVEVVAQVRPEVKMPSNKTVYLTFDDGPGPYTSELLEVLDKYQIKATFFVTDSEHKDFMKKIVDRGHSIGIHTVTHDYETVYASPEAFFEDLRNMQNIILETTGVKTTLMRFPGGSSNTVSKNTYMGLMTLLSEAVQDAGYQYFDWNVDSMDAGGARSAKTVARNVIQGIAKEPVSVVLQHDIHSYSVEAVEEIILWCLDRGYTFLPLNASSPGFHHPIVN